MTLTLTNRTALVTGASAGLGRHFAGVLAAAGARVALAARRRESLDAAVSEIEAAGGQAIAVPLDVTNAASVRNGVREAAGAFGGLDILVNNAGATVAKPALDYAEEEWDRVIDTNLKGAFLTAQETARVMREQGRGGSIVNIASILGLRVAGHVVAYTASKAGLVQMTQALALEWARYGIRVNALAPGYMETDLNRDFLATDAGQALIRRVPQRRLGRLADLDGPLLLLCSDASAYMTGAVVPVDGGHLVSTL
ncbi:SDR family NAD(P)-dependent oxidoreductase [Azospirillum argentinense]|uniref:SDR family oxidoreductase n=1 Tax=Azospirillum brasilense TaxID=192 RepID=A0A4D8PX85_AZOBR|nr:SDR family NAD(P)-dependent oxidoreductase [Azospirillum argentinense]QCO01688.1 SDR family oxidoreductase [Azospirillum argentinense]